MPTSSGELEITEAAVVATLFNREQTNHKPPPPPPPPPPDLVYERWQ